MTPIYPIRMLRLMTGETLVAGIAKSGKNSYILEKPMLMSVVVVQPEIDDAVASQEVSVMMKNWMDFTAEDYIVVRKEIVMCIVKPIQGIVSDYTQARINADMVEDMRQGGDAILGFDESPETEGGEGDRNTDYDEFPGWGGEPRM